MEETNSIAIVAEAPRDPPNAPIRTPIDELCPTAKSSDKMKINELIPHKSHVQLYMLGMQRSKIPNTHFQTSTLQQMRATNKDGKSVVCVCV